MSKIEKPRGQQSQHQPEKNGKQRTAEHITRDRQLRREIAKRKSVEKAFGLTKFAVDNAADIILWINKDGCLIEINNTACKALGYSRKELLAMKLWEIDLFFSEETWQGAWEGVKQKISNSLISSLRTKSGRTFPIEAKAIYLKYENDEYIFSSLRDITTRNRAKMALQESERKYRTIFKTAREGIVLIDLETGDIVDCNPEFSRQTGRSLDELQKDKIWEIRPPEKVELARQTFLKIRKKGTGGSTELEFQKPDGQIVHVDFISNKLQIGGRQYSQSITRDITKQKQTDAALQKLLNEELKLREQLENQISQRTDFTRALVHELNTPLTPLVAATDFLASEVREEPALSFVKNIQMGINSLRNRIEELLDLARGEVGMLQLRYKWVNPRQTLKEIAEYMMLETSKYEQTMMVDIPKFLPTIWIDEERFRQITINLMDNACKFTRKGGVIILKAYQDKGSLIVEVQDTGRGISKTEQQRLFIPYYTLARGKQSHGGLGLGLALSKMLVELHHGELWVESKRGTGSKFAFSIPYSD